MSQVWLIGRPVAHSLSPAMHNAAFAKLGLPHRYEAKETADEELAPTLDRMRREDDVLGANVTIPHKESVLRLLDEVDDEARRIGAVNTIVSRGARLIGYNTDKYGFERALEAQVPNVWNSVGFPFADDTILVLGAGGAARACALALLEQGNNVNIANRNPARAEALARSLEVEGRHPEVVPWPKGRLQVDAIVNATPIGLNGEEALEDVQLPDWVIDLVPTAEETPLVKRAKATDNVTVVDGLSMLLHQAARSFELWTGVPAPIEVMRAALPRVV
ncbi:MAG: shikimate dehydrogenase [Actinobacteria bacterium 13_2_20CM_2_66_6]|nr:MAG: shikimate dehydrogenase [Actinobacteria bacterium 13_2_20CM_2_66_6]